MKRIVFALIISLSVVYAHAQDNRSLAVKAPRLKVGVVLGGGGAKGASHIGVLKYIEEMGIPVDYVAGTSMGSIIGGFYALGYSPDELTELIANMNWSEYIGNKIDRPMMSTELRQRNSTLLLQVPFSLENLFDKKSSTSFISQLPSAYVNNSSLVNLFNNLCVGYQDDMDFNDLPIPFACVATDMITGDEIVLRSGSMPTAMRASMAIPGVFSPVPYGDKVLVDGGLVNNFPADVLLEMGADIIIGVEVTSTKDVSANDLKSLPQVFGQLLINTTSAKRIENRKLCDVHIIPDISGFGMLSFTPEAIDTLVSRGYKRASDFHDQLLSIKHAVDSSAGHPVSKTLHAPHAKNLAKDAVFVRSININNVGNRDSRWLLRKGGLKMGRRYLQDNIEQAMKIYRGTGCFDEITYQLKRNDSVFIENDQLSDAYDLNVNMKPAKPHVFGLGIRYDTEEGAALLFKIGLNEKKFGGSKINANVRLSYNPKINLTYTYSRSSLANFNLAYDYRNQHFRVMYVGNKSSNLHYQQQKISAYISQFHLLNLSTAVGVSYISTTYDPTAIGGDSFWDSLIFTQNKLLSPYINFAYDNLDDAYFAKHGIMSHFAAHYYYDKNHDEYTSGNNFDICYDFQAYITPFNSKLTLIPQIYGRYIFLSSSHYNLFNLCGSETPGVHFENQMPFIGKTTVVSLSSNSSILRCDLRYNFFGKHYLSAMYNMAVLWDDIEIGENYGLMGIYHGAGLKYSYNSILGPISLTAHWSNLFINNFGAYFSFGYTF